MDAAKGSLLTALGIALLVVILELQYAKAAVVDISVSPAPVDQKEGDPPVSVVLEGRPSIVTCNYTLGPDETAKLVQIVKGSSRKLVASGNQITSSYVWQGEPEGNRYSQKRQGYVFGDPSSRTLTLIFTETRVEESDQYRCVLDYLSFNNSHSVRTDSRAYSTIKVLQVEEVPGYNVPVVVHSIYPVPLVQKQGDSPVSVVQKGKTAIVMCNYTLGRNQTAYWLHATKGPSFERIASGGQVSPLNVWDGERTGNQFSERRQGHVLGSPSSRTLAIVYTGIRCEDAGQYACELDYFPLNIWQASGPLPTLRKAYSKISTLRVDGCLTN